jgi:ketosteroid isomerase-like protein
VTREPGEVVRECFAAWDRGDLDGVLANYAEDVEVDASRLLDGVYRGRPAVRGYFERIVEVFRLSNEGLSTREEQGTVFALVQMRAIGTVSGASTEAPFGYVFEVEDGLVRRVTFYPDASDMPPA